MNEPHSLHVFGTKYRLKRLSRLSKRGLDGECDKESKTIAVDAALKGEQYWECLLHELFHAVERECSIEQAVPLEVLEIINDIYAKAVVKNCNLSHKMDKKRSK